MIESEPAISVLSVLHTIKLRRVTHSNGTFIEWTTDFSKDATVAVTADAQCKQAENFEFLCKAMSSASS
jgi:hypothetical protein